MITISNESNSSNVAMCLRTFVDLLNANTDVRPEVHTRSDATKGDWIYTVVIPVATSFAGTALYEALKLAVQQLRTQLRDTDRIKVDAREIKLLDLLESDATSSRDDGNDNPAS